MRVPARTIDGGVGFNMTPMIDVTFQLIIFFLLSSHLARQEKQLPLPLPAAASGQASAGDDRPRLTINVLADGTMLVGNRPIALDDLARLLTERKAAHGDRLEVRIRADRHVLYRRIEPILPVCAAAGIWNVGYAVVGR
jgi:biopolymer transport protein ExbD